MPRPTSESITPAPGGGFGASPDTTFGNIEVSPVHQLDVDGATENAHMLANIFAKGADIADTVIKQKQSDADAQGYLDGSVGAVNVGGQPAISAGAYAAGAKRAQVQMTAVTASNQAKQFFAQHPDMPLLDSTDKDGNTVPGLMTSVDQIFKQAFPGGAEQDPVVARLIAPLVQHTFNEITGASYQASIQKTQQSAEDAATALATHDAQNPGGGLFDPQTTLDTLTKVYGGDARQGRDALVHSVGEAAVQAGDPSLIEKYLPNDLDLGNGATLTPANLSYLDGARNRATAASQKTNATQLKSAAMNVVTTIASGKDPQAALDAYSKMPGADPDFYKAQIQWFRSQGADSASRAVDSVDAANLQGNIANGTISSIEQATQYIAQHGYKAGAAVELTQKAGTWLSSVQSTQADDPTYKANRARLDDLYKAGIDPVTSKWTKPGAQQQWANVLSGYSDAYNQSVNQGVSPTVAATQAAEKVQNQFKAPIGLEDDPVNRTKAMQVPGSDDHAAAYLNDPKNLNAHALNAAGITGPRLKQLRDTGRISADVANQAAQAIIAGRTN